MPFCPNCGYEYREGIKICPDCGRELVAQPPEHPHDTTAGWPPADSPQTAQEPLALVYEAPNAALAEAVKITLKNAGIPFAEEILQYPILRPGPEGSAGGHYARLWVAKSRAAEARQLIDDQIAAYESGDLDLQEQIDLAAEKNDGLEPHGGGIILALGIIGLVTWSCSIGLVFGLIAWIMGNKDLRKMEQGLMAGEGRGMTQAGCICGVVATILAGVVVIISLVEMLRPRITALFDWVSSLVQ